MAAYAHFFFLPVNREIAELKSRLVEAEQQAEGAVPLVAAIGATQKQLEAIEQYTHAWEEDAPSEFQLTELFERIHRLTRLSETTTTRFEPQPAVAYETFLRIPVTMEFRGRFAQVAAVLTGLEQLPEPIWVTGLDIESAGEDSEDVHAEISLDVFADNLEDSDQENLSVEPITEEVDLPDVQVERSTTDL
ncbi:MAG: type IV pilus inner membrane component PilO [Thermoguttaceae bacterium]